MFLGATTAILPLGTNTCTKSKLMWYGMHVGWLVLAPWPLVSCHITCLVGCGVLVIVYWLLCIMLCKYPGYFLIVSLVVYSLWDCVVAEYWKLYVFKLIELWHNIGQLITCVWNCRLTPIIVFPLTSVACSRLPHSCNFWPVSTVSTTLHAIQSNCRRIDLNSDLWLGWNKKFLTLATRCWWGLGMGLGNEGNHSPG